MERQPTTRNEAKIWREWPYVGSLVTPTALIDPVSWAHYKKTGEFREGTVIAKELTRARAPVNKNHMPDFL